MKGLMMDRNTKIGFAVAGWCIFNLAYVGAQSKQRLAKLERVQKKLVTAHNDKVFSEKFENIVQHYDRD